MGEAGPGGHAVGGGEFGVKTGDACPTREDGRDAMRCTVGMGEAKAPLGLRSPGLPSLSEPVPKHS